MIATIIVWDQRNNLGGRAKKIINQCSEALLLSGPALRTAQSPKNEQICKNMSRNQT